ncbi:restriction endonuclease [Leptolyngbya sp. O-77]|uniref:restriction endonuclease n=1 Tax=Leptolyngbya sp. O-77 TaxID=1080068 RepID=UPI00074D3474|nr:restriction endonuclease [Leptolyngbya sp. O-77]BAU42442.1 Restriction endonuclease [Leptolyngbya sp. O-77]
MPKLTCIECGKKTTAKHPILEVSLCRACRSENSEKYGFVTKTRAVREYRLKPDELYALKFIEEKNPHWRTGPHPMHLFLHQQVKGLSEQKWGSAEPYTVTLSQFSEQLLSWFLEDLDRLKQLPPDKFQYFVADRLERLGLEPKLVGDVYRKDGGVDIIAYPKNLTVPFLLAVQAKHHRKDRKTSVSDVRDFHGVLNSHTSPFHMGMLVTNTSFTPDAKWFANNNQKLLRLRDMKDLCRWLKEDFTNEHEWREIPEEVELAPGIRIQIPKQKVWLTDKS